MKQQVKYHLLRISHQHFALWLWFRVWETFRGNCAALSLIKIACKMHFRSENESASNNKRNESISKDLVTAAWKAANELFVLTCGNAQKTISENRINCIIIWHSADVNLLHSLKNAQHSANYETSTRSSPKNFKRTIYDDTEFQRQNLYSTDKASFWCAH